MILYALIAYVSAYHSIILILQSRFYRKLIKVLFSFVRFFTFCSCHSCDIVSSATNIYIIMLSSSTEKVIIFDSVKKKYDEDEFGDAFLSRAVCSRNSCRSCLVAEYSRGKRDKPKDVGSTCRLCSWRLHTHPGVFQMDEKKKSPINNYGELGFVVAFHRSLLIRLDYSSSETVDVMTIIILSIIEYFLQFSIFWYNNDPLL